MVSNNSIRVNPLKWQLGFYSKTYNYLDTVGEVTNLASGGGTELPLSEMSTYFSTLL